MLNKHASSEEHHGLMDSSNNERRNTLSAVLLNEGSQSPSTKATADELEPLLEFLYSTRFFKWLMWLLQLLVFALAVVVFTRATLIPSAFSTLFFRYTDAGGAFFLFQGGGVLDVMASVVWGTGVLFIFVVCGSFCSRAFR